MSKDRYGKVAKSVYCAKIGSRFRNKKLFQHLPAAELLDFVAADIHGPLPKLTQGKQHVVVITDSYSKLTRASPTSKTLLTTMKNVSLNHWIVCFCIPSYLLTDNGPKFIIKFFVSICGYLDMKHLTTTKYHPQTNGQAKQYNCTIITQLRHDFAAHQLI